MSRSHRTSGAHHALSSAGRTILRELLRSAPLLAFDFDGTLAPIVSDPSAAQLSRATSARLAALAARSPCVVISGRARADVRERLAGLPLAEVIGNHGSEPFVDLEPLRAQVARWRPALMQRLGHLTGVQIEDKGCSLSIHYRNATARHEALTTALDAVQRLGVGRIIPGKYVLNLLPSGALDKGSGLRQVMAQQQKTRALYVGDDDTDEDVFRLPAAAGVVGVRVDFRSSSRAPLYIYGQPEMDDLLDHLAKNLPEP